MPITAQQSAFKEKFADKIRKTANKAQRHLPEGHEHDLALQFVKTLITYKTHLDANSQASSLLGDLPLWAEERQKLISNFINELEAIFRPMGGIKAIGEKIEAFLKVGTTWNANKMDEFIDKSPRYQFFTHEPHAEDPASPEHSNTEKPSSQL